MKVVNLEQLTEVKRGQTGTGLLIEHDGHINTNSNIISQIKEDIDNHHKFVIPEHFVVSAVFQKYGIKNANGRIYPEGILKREVEKYKTNIQNHNAVGSLDHPSCQLADTQILTETGWKYIPDVVEGENILTVTPNKKIEICPVLRKIEEEYNGTLIHLKGRFIDIKVTPNHKFPIFGKDKEFKRFYTAQDILEHSIIDQDNCSFLKAGEWNNGNDDFFVVKQYISLGDETLSVTEEQYNGKVYCVEVKNHTFYTMCPNGKCLWSGNSSSISGHDIAHNILDLRWEGATLVGEMELHLSPGYIRYGVCSTSGDLVANMLLSGYLIGVSSRGVGSVEQKYGNYVVGDDFELICWDVVIEPSTPGAYIKNTQSELETFIESDKNFKNHSPLLEKISEINKILME